jgi:hypothetical protein
MIQLCKNRTAIKVWGLIVKTDARCVTGG